MSEQQPPLADSLLPYDRWTEEAMREVALKALDHAAREGLPGEHHFYLTFRTDAPGVAVPGHLRARYPQEMTVVLQHQFWDLKVDRAAKAVSVGLSFGGNASTLVIPFAAITAFLDPHVRLGLRFGNPAAEAEAGDAGEDAAAPTGTDSPAGSGEVRPLLPPAGRPQPSTAASAVPGGAEKEGGTEETPAPKPAQVVSLDQFRKRPAGGGAKE